jgi:hypothetical protein
MSCCAVNRNGSSPMCGRCADRFAEWGGVCLCTRCVLGSCLPCALVCLAFVAGQLVSFLLQHAKYLYFCADCSATQWGYLILFFLANMVYVAVFHFISQSASADTNILFYVSCAFSFWHLLFPSLNLVACAVRPAEYARLYDDRPQCCSCIHLLLTVICYCSWARDGPDQLDKGVRLQ